MSDKCQEHYPAEMDEAINAGACPICQSAEIDRLTRELSEAQATIVALSEALEDCGVDADEILRERKP